MARTAGAKPIKRIVTPDIAPVAAVTETAVPLVGRTRAHTVIDVARAAGVSPAAVSRAFQPGSSISAAKRQAVLEAARSLRYRR